MIDFRCNWRGKLLQKRYCLQDLIAEGRYSRVFLAIDLASDHQKCVIKELVYDSYPADVKQAIELIFQQEAKILRKLTYKHTQICQFYNYFTDSGSCYLVQEWIQGITLEKKLRSRKKLSESETRNIILNLLPVLECIHSLGIIHGNINPSNIILRSTDNLPILIDFSLAREVEDCPPSQSEKLYKPTSKIDTTEYIPPEQLIGQTTYNQDLYNLGLTAIHLLTGRSPKTDKRSALTGEHRSPQRADPASAKDARECCPRQAPYHSTTQCEGADTCARGMARLPRHIQSKRWGCPKCLNAPSLRRPGVAAPFYGGVTVTSSAQTRNPLLESVAKVAPPDIHDGCLHCKTTRNYSSITPSPFRHTNFALNSPDHLWHREKTAFNPNLVAAIDRAIAAHPHYRFTSAQEMRLTLQFPQQKLSLIQAEIKGSAANKSQGKLWILCLIMCVEIAAVWLGRRYLIPIPDYQPPLDFSDLPQTESFIPLPSDDFTESIIVETTNDALQAVIFSPGISKNKILQALGEPVWRKPGFWADSIAWSYKDIVSEGIDIGYIFDRHTNKLRQAEIAVSSSTNLSTVKSALKSLLKDELLTDTIEQGLQAVYQRQKATHNFTAGNLEGIIQRNHQDRIYIGVWQADFH